MLALFSTYSSFTPFSRRHVIASAGATAAITTTTQAVPATAVPPTTVAATAMPRAMAVEALLQSVPCYLVTNQAGEPYLTEVDESGRRCGSVYLGPKDAAAVLQDVRAYDRSATLAVVPLSNVYDQVAKTTKDAELGRQSAPQPRGSVSSDMRLFRLRGLSDETSGESVSMLPGASLAPGIPLFYEPTLFLGASESERRRPYAFRLADLNTVWRAGNGDDRNLGRVSPSLRTQTLEGLIRRYADGLEEVAPLLLPPSETAELSYKAAGEGEDNDGNRGGGNGGGGGMPAARRARSLSMMAEATAAEEAAAEEAAEAASASGGKEVSRVLVCVGHLCECQGEAGLGARAMLRELKELTSLQAPVQETVCLGMCGMGAAGCVEYADGSEDLVVGREQMLSALKLDRERPESVPESCVAELSVEEEEKDVGGQPAAVMDAEDIERVLVCTGRMCQREKGGGTLLLDELQARYPGLAAEGAPCLGCCGQGSMMQLEYASGCEPSVIASNVNRLQRTLEKLGVADRAAAAGTAAGAAAGAAAAGGAAVGAKPKGGGGRAGASPQMMAASSPEPFTVSLEKPLGLLLEENEAGGGEGGVQVGSVLEGSAAEKCGEIQAGDALLKVGDADVSVMSFDEVMETLVAAVTPVSLTLAHASYSDDDKALDITPNLVKSLKPEDSLLVDRTVRAARAAVRASPRAARELGRLLRVEIIVGAGVQPNGDVKVRFFGIFSTGAGGSYSCNVSATGSPGSSGGAEDVEITKLSCAKDEGWGQTIDLIR